MSWLRAASTSSPLVWSGGCTKSRCGRRKQFRSWRLSHMTRWQPALSPVLLDPAEISFAFDTASRFEDLETAEEVMAVPAVVREHYLEAMDALVDRYRRDLGACGIDYCQLTTDQPLEIGLLAYLSTRARRL